MRRLALALLALLFFAAPAAARFEPWAGPKPVAIFTEFNPWLMVIGSDTPRVAIYENGEVIFVKQIGEAYAYHSIKLTPAQLQELEARWQSVFAVTPPKDGYDVSDATDQATASFYLRHGEQTFRTHVYGWSCRGGVHAPVDLKPDARRSLAVSDDGTVRLLEVRVHKRELVQTSAGHFLALKLETSSGLGGMFKGGGTFLLWLSDDERKLPVRFEAKVKLGRVFGSVKQVRLSNEPPTRVDEQQRVPTK